MCKQENQTEWSKGWVYNDYNASSQIASSNYSILTHSPHQHSSLHTPASKSEQVPLCGSGGQAGSRCCWCQFRSQQGNRVWYWYRGWQGPRVWHWFRCHFRGRHWALRNWCRCRQSRYLDVCRQ
jgi:hypothetical protein